MLPIPWKNNWYRTVFLCVWGGFLVSAILGIRYVLPPEPVRYAHFTIESTVFSIYLADLFFLLLIPLLYSFTKHSTSLVKYIVILIIPFLSWSLLSILWAPRQDVALYGWGRLLQAIVVGVLIAFIARDRRLRSLTVWVLILLGVAQAVLSLVQVSKGQSVGLHMLGEPRISLSMPGVAKIDLPDGSKMLRGYGTFPHPNILGAFLLLSSAITVFALPTVRRSILMLMLSTAALFLEFLGIVSTFSRSTYLALVLGMISFFVYRKSLGIDRKDVRTVGGLLVLTFLIAYLATPLALISRTVPPPNDQFVNERLFLFKQEKRVLGERWIYGTGMTSYPVFLSEIVPSGTVKPWQYEYPHAVPLAITGDLGVVGLLLFFLLLTQVYLQLKKRHIDRTMFFIVLLMVLPLTLLDHYLWTMQAGRLLLWSGMGLCFFLLFPEEIAEKVP